MSKEEIKQKIVELLKDSRFGLNVKSISKKLKYSRTTIAKYLKILEVDGFVLDREIGQYKIWIHKDALYGKTEINPLDSLIFSIYSSMLKFMQKDLNSDYIKNMGMSIAKDFNFSNYIDISTFINTENISDFSTISVMLMKTIDSICKLYDNYSWSPPIIIENKSIIVIRMYNSQLLQYPYHFHLLAGFIEQEMNKFVNGKVNVINIDEEQKIVDFQFELIL